jgi:hypothetical protein
MEVEITSRPGHVEMEAAGVPNRQLVEFAARFTDRYRADLAELGTSEAQPSEPLLRLEEVVWAAHGGDRGVRRIAADEDRLTD